MDLQKNTLNAGFKIYFKSCFIKMPHKNLDLLTRNSYLQMSRAFLASPDTADTFLAQN